MKGKGSLCEREINQKLSSKINQKLSWCAGRRTLLGARSALDGQKDYIFCVLAETPPLPSPLQGEGSLITASHHRGGELITISRVTLGV